MTYSAIVLDEADKSIPGTLEEVLLLLVFQEGGIETIPLWTGHGLVLSSLVRVIPPELSYVRHCLWSLEEQGQEVGISQKGKRRTMDI